MNNNRKQEKPEPQKEGDAADKIPAFVGKRWKYILIGILLTGTTIVLTIVTNIYPEHPYLAEFLISFSVGTWIGLVILLVIGNIFLKRTKAIASRTYNLAATLNCTDTELAKAIRQSMTTHNALPNVIQGAANEDEITESILRWSETHLEILRAQLKRDRDPA